MSLTLTSLSTLKSFSTSAVRPLLSSSSRISRLPTLSQLSPVRRFSSSVSHRALRSIHSSPARLNKSHISSTCTSCSRPLLSSLPACTNCWTISHLPPDVKHHDIFALPYEPNPFIVDLSVLKQKFREAQALCHPDSWASKGSNQQDIAQALSARINEAYQALLNPLARAEYILQRHHIPISETDQLEDMELMTEVMLARETIEEADDPSELTELVEGNQVKIQTTIDELEVLVGQQEWDQVKGAIVRLRYLESISRAAKKWLDNH